MFICFCTAAPETESRYGRIHHGGPLVIVPWPAWGFYEAIKRENSSTLSLLMNEFLSTGEVADFFLSLFQVTKRNTS